MLRKDSHMIEPPPRDEEFKIEWRCITCGMEGTCGVGNTQNAREVFKRMYQNHKHRTNVLVVTPYPGHPNRTLQMVMSTCPHPTFKWARIA
jgi:hypothetical protein